jgi:BolA protein
MNSTQTQLEQALSVLQPSVLNIEDDSALHAGHAGNTGGSHFTLLIVSDQFQGLSLIKRHRFVHTTVGTLLEKEIHALSIKALTPSEYEGH